MIEIDDAGSGSLIGGTGIGVRRAETAEYIFEVIPLKYFQKPHFLTKKYQRYVIKIIRGVFQKFSVSKKELICVCRGYIFDALRHWLTKRGYFWQSVKIDGALQEQVEESFRAYVIGLGLPENFVKHARFAFGFHRLLKWVMADLPQRANFCKTGWKSWEKWSQVKNNIYKTTLTTDRYCLKCGAPIQKQQPAIILEYVTTHRYTVELHPLCWTPPS